MIEKNMTSGISRNDSFYGTIVSANRNGMNIRLDIEGLAGNVIAFAFSGGEIGQKVLVSIVRFNERFNNFIVSVDSFLNLETAFATEAEAFEPATQIAA